MSPLNRQSETPLAQIRRRAIAVTCAALFVIACAEPSAATAIRPAAKGKASSTAPQNQLLPAVRQLPQHPTGLPHYPVRPSPGGALQTPHQPQQQNAGPKEYPQPVTQLRSTRHVVPNSSTKKPAVRPKHLDPLGNRIPRTTPDPYPLGTRGTEPLPAHPTPRTSLYPPIPGASALYPEPPVKNRLDGKPLLTSHHSTSAGANNLPRNALPVPRPDSTPGSDTQPDKFERQSENDSAAVPGALPNPLPNLTHRGLEQLPVVPRPVLPEGTEFRQTDGQSEEPLVPWPTALTVYPVGDGRHSPPIPSTGGVYPSDDAVHFNWKDIVRDLFRAEALAAYLDSLPMEAFQDDRRRDELDGYQRELIQLRGWLRTVPPDAMAYATGLANGQKSKDSHGATPSSGGSLGNPGGGGDGGVTVIPVRPGANQKGDGKHGWGVTTPGGGGENNNAGGANDNDGGGGNTPPDGGADQDHGTRSPDQADNQADDGGDAGNGGGGDGDGGDCDDGTESGPADVREAIDDVHRSSGRCDNLAPDPDSGGGGGASGNDVGARGKLPKPAPGVTQQDKDLVGDAFGTTTGAGDEERVRVGERGNGATTQGNHDLEQDLRGRINNGTGGATVEGVISQLWWQRNAPRAQPPK